MGSWEDIDVGKLRRLMEQVGIYLLEMKWRTRLGNDPVTGMLLLLGWFRWNTWMAVGVLLHG